MILRKKNIIEEVQLFTKTEILQIAKAQFALDYNCPLADFEKEGNSIVENLRKEGRRIYDHDGCFFKILCMGGKAIISTTPEMMAWSEETLKNRDAAWLFEYPRLRAIDKKLHEFGHEIADIHQYYLPKPNTVRDERDLCVRWYEAEDIGQFQNDDRFQEAFVFDENYPDVLAIAALDGETIMGMAGASADSDTMWQMGVDVLPAYRGKGIGTRLVRILKDEILKRGKVPFYGTVASHFHSLNIAVNAGFFPAWAELYSRKMK